MQKRNYYKNVKKNDIGPGKVIAIIDLGSNSARLLLVRLLQGGTYTVLNRVKHMVRLGENSFQTKLLQESAMQRTLLVLRSFADMCRTYNVDEILPIATAAVRDAENAKDFLYRVREKTGLDLMVISGKEEARLISLGVSAGLSLSLALRIFIDIGGGSTEIAVANSVEHQCLDSLKLGCVRLTNRFLEGHTESISTELFTQMCQYVRRKAGYTLERVRALDVAEVVGSSGTALALHSIAFRLQHGEAPNAEHNVLTLEGLRLACTHICAMTTEERRTLPGMSIRRTEVLVAGAAILVTLLEELHFDHMYVNSRNLQDGILVDYMRKNNHEPTEPVRSVREHSVLQLSHRCQFEEHHARHMAGLALQLHDSAVDCGLIHLDHQKRELLYYAALLHDIGIFIAYARHAAHSAYLIRNTELLGFNEEEIIFMALLARFHSTRPSKKYEELSQYSEEMLASLRVFTLFLALGENMDRLHCQHVHEVGFRQENTALILEIHSRTTSPIESDVVVAMHKVLKKTLGKDVDIRFMSL